MEHKQAGNAAYGQSRWTEAAEHYTAALAADPGLVAALANRAACWIHLERFADALADCDAALANNAPAQLQTKLLWRKAVALRSLGRDREAWRAAVRAGLDLDPHNAKLLEEQQYVFVKNVRTMPAIYTGAAPSHAADPSKADPSKPALGSASSAGPKSQFPLPLTYSGLLHLVRAKSSATHAFWYANVSGADLRRVLAAGVEPDMLDYLFGLIAAHPHESERNREYMEALQASPRFETALFMADDNAYERALRATS